MKFIWHTVCRNLPFDAAEVFYSWCFADWKGSWPKTCCSNNSWIFSFGDLA